LNYGEPYYRSEKSIRHPLFDSDRHTLSFEGAGVNQLTHGRKAGKNHPEIQLRRE
jgi:hypothetical protein